MSESESDLASARTDAIGDRPFLNQIANGCLGVCEDSVKTVPRTLEFAPVGRNLSSVERSAGSLSSQANSIGLAI